MPAWFEDAARKLLGDTGGDGRGLSVAEMTLVSAAPTKHVSPSLRNASAPPAQSQQGGAGTGTQYDAPPAPDIEELAQEVYETVMRMIDLARERNGDPWQQT